MADVKEQSAKKTGFYRRMEGRLLQWFPAVITPLRFRILAGYLLVLLLGIYGWAQIASAWRYLITLLAPVATLLGALLALKLSVVFVSLFTLLSALVKVFLGFLMVVLKPGILKAIFVPQVVSLIGWVHRKSSWLQLRVKKFYEHVKAFADNILAWWKGQQAIDKILLSGFLVPLLIVLLIVFIVKRAIAIFAVKKFTEQVVQKTTKFVIKNFHRLPLIGGVPALLVASARKLTAKDDRVDLVNDLASLKEEIYKPDSEKFSAPDETVTRS
ncbi:hypothetical protein AB833_01185 [Chromatiales bacterium (ex Bugula neritina AB1)]|nr:hypothetical protein AB833_01185 [Chromatiales bacterium (ex Bugula neritina AB1)]